MTAKTLLQATVHPSQGTKDRVKVGVDDDGIAYLLVEDRLDNRTRTAVTLLYNIDGLIEALNRVLAARQDVLAANPGVAVFIRRCPPNEYEYNKDVE